MHQYTKLIFFYSQATNPNVHEISISWVEKNKEILCPYVDDQVPLLRSRVEAHETKKEFKIARFDFVNTQPEVRVIPK